MNIHDPGVEVYICLCGKPISPYETECTECALENARTWEAPDWFLLPIGALAIALVIAVFWMLETAWNLHMLFRGLK